MTGSGTELDPYIITTKEDLQNVQNDLTAWYELGGDIDCESTQVYIVGQFTGHFDGKGYTISNNVITISITTAYVGLFQFIWTGAVVTDFTITGMSIVATGNVDGIGLLAGYIYDATVTKISVTGTITGGDDYIGGFVGYAYLTTLIEGCSANVTITVGTAGDDYTGGFCGYMNGATVSRCYSTGSVTRSKTGGLYAGGFAGMAQSSFIDDCYSTASVTAYNNVGGFVGRNAGTEYTNCFSTGLIDHGTGTAIGGFCGYDSLDGAQMTSCYWDTETSGEATSDGGTGKTTVEMKTQSTFSGYDFSIIWNITDSYPFLRTYGADAVATGLVTQSTGLLLTLNGTAEGSGISKVYFRYGTSTGVYPYTTDEQDYASTFTAIINVPHSTKYYYTAVGKLNDDSLIYGIERYFTLYGKPANVGAIEWNYSSGIYRQTVKLGGFEKQQSFIHKAQDTQQELYDPIPRYYFPYWRTASCPMTRLKAGQYLVFHTLIVPQSRTFFIGAYGVCSQSQGGQLLVVQWDPVTETWEAIPAFPAVNADQVNFDDAYDVYDSYDEGGTPVAFIVYNDGEEDINGISAFVAYSTQYLPGGLP